MQAKRPKQQHAKHKVKLIVSGDDRTLKIWDIDEEEYIFGEPVLILRGHQASITNVIFDSERNLISGAFDGTLRFWNLEKVPINLSIREGLSKACNRLKKHPQGSEIKEICQNIWENSSTPQF